MLLGPEIGLFEIFKQFTFGEGDLDEGVGSAVEQHGAQHCRAIHLNAQRRGKKRNTDKSTHYQGLTDAHSSVGSMAAAAAAERAVSN